MQRAGVEAGRRQALIDAAIVMIGEHGSLDVPVKEIATRAGMSSALAFHYFGGKDEIIVETMRYLLRQFTQVMSSGLSRAKSPRQRMDAILRASFGGDQFDRTTIAAWLTFYLKAFSNPKAARLLAIYTARLESNLVHAFKLCGMEDHAVRDARMLGALIDGIYIRHALRPDGPDTAEALADCRALVDALTNSGSGSSSGPRGEAN
ncbi:MAG: transcriptional regulator BetI [Nitratireductor sp.]|nr:transcriptional regulator BetI [Nitratireductor sp.]